MKISQKNSVVSQNLEWNAQLGLCSRLLRKAVGRKRQAWYLEQSQNLGSSKLSKSSMTLWNNVELNWGEKCSDNGRCVSSMSIRGCQNSKVPMNCGRLPQMIASLAFWQKMKPANIVTVWEFLGWLKWKCLHPCDHQKSLQSVNKFWLQNAKLEQITFWQSTTLIHRPTQMLIALLRSRKCETSWMHGLQNHFTTWNLIT